MQKLKLRLYRTLPSKEQNRNTGQKQVEKCIYWSLGLRRWEIPQPSWGDSSVFYILLNSWQKKTPSVTQCSCMWCGHVTKAKTQTPCGLGTVLVTWGLSYSLCFAAVTWWDAGHVHLSVTWTPLSAGQNQQEMDTCHWEKDFREHSYSDTGIPAYLGGGPALDTQAKTRWRAPLSLHLARGQPQASLTIATLLFHASEAQGMGAIVN